MTPQQFTWFLRGALTGKSWVKPEEMDTIKGVLNNVFKDHIDPSYPTHQQQTLQEAHQGKVDLNVKLRC